MNKFKFLLLLLPFNLALAADNNCFELTSKLGMGTGNVRIVHDSARTRLRKFVKSKLKKHDMLSAESCKFCEMAFTPFKKVTSLSHLEAVASRTIAPALKELAEKIVKAMHTFDQKAHQWGFTIPESNRVLFWEKKQKNPDFFLGLYYYKTPVFNLWRGKTQNITIFEIVSGELQNVAKIANGQSVLFHERAHAFLLRTYSARAFVNNNVFFQEALADFFAAHALDDPRILPLGEDTSLRDIRDKSYYVESLGQTLEAITLAGVSKYTPNSNSLLISNVLWQVREAIGPDKMSKMLRPLTDNLNRYRESFEARFMDFEVLKGVENSENYTDYVDYRDKFVNDFQYFLAVLKRTAKDTGNFIKVDQVITRAVDDFNLYSDGIDYIAGHIEKSNDLFALNKEKMMAETRSMLYRRLGYFALENSFWFAGGVVLGYAIGMF